MYTLYIFFFWKQCLKNARGSYFRLHRKFKQFKIRKKVKSLIMLEVMRRFRLWWLSRYFYTIRFSPKAKLFLQSLQCPKSKLTFWNRLQKWKKFEWKLASKMSQRGQKTKTIIGWCSSFQVNCSNNGERELVKNIKDH